MTKNICISGYYGFDNFGDETILQVLVENLKEFLDKPKITVFSVNPNKTSQRLGVESVQTFSLKEVVKSLYNCDCLISGGGSLLQDVTSLKSLIYYLGVIFVAKLFRKKVIIFAQGIGPIKNKLLARLTKFLLKKAVYVSVRDKNSFNLLNSWGVDAKLCNDPVWNTNIKEKTENGKIGVQLRSFPTLTNDFINELAKCINQNYSDKEINIISCQNKLDLTPSIKLKEILKDLNPKINVNVIENTSHEKLIQEICNLDDFIAMRYHACLIGIKAGVKVLPVNYDIKVETLSKDFGLESIDIKSFDNMHEIIERFKNKCLSCDMVKVNSLKFDFDELCSFLYKDSNKC